MSEFGPDRADDRWPLTARPPGLLLDPRVPEIGDFSTRDLIDELAARLGATEAPHWPAEGDDDGG